MILVFFSFWETACLFQYLLPSLFIRSSFLSTPECQGFCSLHLYSAFFSPFLTLLPQNKNWVHEDWMNGLKNLLLWNTILSYLQMQFKFSNRCFKHQQLTVLILNSILKIRDEKTNVVWKRFFPTILPLILSFVHRNLIIEQSKMVWILSTSLYY